MGKGDVSGVWDVLCGQIRERAERGEVSVLVNRHHEAVPVFRDGGRGAGARVDEAFGSFWTCEMLGVTFARMFSNYEL